MAQKGLSHLNDKTKQICVMTTWPQHRSHPQAPFKKRPRALLHPQWSVPSHNYGLREPCYCKIEKNPPQSSGREWTKFCPWLCQQHTQTTAHKHILYVINVHVQGTRNATSFVTRMQKEVGKKLENSIVMQLQSECITLDSYAAFGYKVTLEPLDENWMQDRFTDRERRSPNHIAVVSKRTRATYLK